MKTNILKSFVAMLAIAATVCFAGCKDDESDEDIIPNIAIAESTMSFTNAEETKTLALESNADWQAVVPESADWVTVNPMSGNGDKTVTIAVAENTTGKAREAEVKFSALHPTYGVYDTKKLTIIQSANENEVEEENAIYSDNFDKADGSKNENNQWPAVADCADPKGSAAANVTYKVDGKVTVRNSGKPSSDTDYSSYKGSGVNKVFFGTLPASLVVENIALPADQQNYVLSFGANRYDGTAGADNTYKNEELIVSLSKDGVAWTPIEYSFEEGVDLNGKWNLAEASFKLAEVPEALYIKFEAKIASIISIDDIKLATGGAGEQEVVFAEAPVIEDIEGTVTEVLEAEQGANVKAIDATVVAVSSRAYLLTDGTSYILAYMSEGAPEVAVGDEVTVDGEMGSYNNVPQIINPVATKTGTVENFAQPEAAVIDGAALDAYKDNFAIKYVKIADANLVKSGNYWNFTVEGATTTGSLAYPTAEMCPEANNGKKVTVYGYVIYMSGASSQYINVIATSVEVTGEGDAPYEGAEVPETDEADICVDFSNAEVYPEGFPVAKANQVLNATAYTFEGHEFTFAGGGEGNGFYRNTDGYLMLGKKDAYIELPAIEGKALSMVVLTTRKDASKSVQVAIKDAEGNVVEGGKAITLAQLNDKLTYAYALTGTEENTSYRLTVISAHNTQLTHLDLYYTGEGDEPAEPVEMTPAAVAEGYQGAKISWEAVEGAEAYYVYYSLNGEDEVVEIAKDKTEAVITGLADARKYVFAVEAIDAEENVIGEGETAETEIWTLVNWEEPEFSLTLSEDKSKYVFMVANLVEMNYAYAGATIEILKDGELVYTLKNSTADITLCAWFDARMNRWPLGSMNNRKDWTWYKGATDEVVSMKNDGSGLGEGNSVPASFFTAGEYTLNYSIDYVLGVNTIPCTAKPDYGFEPVASMDVADFLRLPNGRADVLFDEADVPHREVKTNGETPVALATIEATLEFASVTAKAEGYQGAKIEWSAVETADAYKVVVNGEEVAANGELSHTVAPETLTDANEYTFTVKAYKGTELLATGEATTQVFTLTNVVEPKVTFDGTTLHVGDCLDLHGVVVDIKVEFVKGGQTVHTATYTKDTQAYNAGGVAGYLNSGKCTVGLFDDFIPASATSQPNWVWNGTESATAPTFEPGTYSIKWTANYYTIVNAYWTTQVGSDYPKDQFKTKAEAVAANAGKARILFENPANDVLVQAIERTGTATDYVVEDPDAEPVVLNAKAAIDEGTVLGRTLWGNNDSWYNGIASVNGLFESVKLSWDAVEADKIVITYNGETVEVEGTATEKVIEGLKTSPVEFTIKAVKGSETLVEEKVSSDVYTLPTADTNAQWVAKYTESGYQILGTGWNTKQYTAAHVTFNVYEKGSTTAVFDKDVNYKGNLSSIIAWTMGEKAPNGVCYAGPGNRACHGGDGNNWDEGNLPTGATTVDGKEVFTGLDPEKEYVVKYTLKVWPYIYDATHAQNVELYTNDNGEKMFNYFFKKMLVSGTADTYYNAVDLQGEADLTFEGVPEPEIEKITIAEFLAKEADETTVYELTGNVIDVENISSGNFTIKDKTGEVYVYGLTYNGSKQNALTEAGVAIPDEITIQGSLKNYNGTLEVVNAVYVSHTVYTGAWITGVDVTEVTFDAAGTKSVAVAIRNGEGVTPSLEGLASPFSAQWNASTNAVDITSTASAAVDAQTLTIAVEGGNSVEVKVNQVAAVATKEYDMITSVEDLAAGEGYLIGGYITGGDLHLCTGGFNSSKHAYTAAYTYNETTGALTTSSTYKTLLTLEAVDGVANAYRIYDTDKNGYWEATKAGSGGFALKTSATDGAYWIFSNNTDGTLHAEYSIQFSGATAQMAISNTAQSNYLRTYSSTQAGVYGLIMFKKN